MKIRRGNWKIRWLNPEKTEGEIIRVKDWRGLPPAPCVEGKIRLFPKEAP